ncbi:hypothetical protein [Mycobacteroides abscessus]|uniref:hypothetical protein n=1 Tax=Mycobacteroides abscessus TaxID=36809 RepID=UPI000C255DA1|nr:hypothetical protein [Mycobacteroides abscessus]
MTAALIPIETAAVQSPAVKVPPQAGDDAIQRTGGQDRCDANADGVHSPCHRQNLSLRRSSTLRWRRGRSGVSSIASRTENGNDTQTVYGQPKDL